MTEDKYSKLRDILYRPNRLIGPTTAPVSFTLDLIRELLAERDTLIKEKEEKWWSETVTDIFVAGGIFGEDMIGECN